MESSKPESSQTNDSIYGDLPKSFPLEDETTSEEEVEYIELKSVEEDSSMRQSRDSKFPFRSNIHRNTQLGLSFASTLQELVSKGTLSSEEVSEIFSIFDDSCSRIIPSLRAKLKVEANVGNHQIIDDKYMQCHLNNFQIKPIYSSLSATRVNMFGFPLGKEKKKRKKMK